MGGVDTKNYTYKIISVLKNKKFKDYKIVICVGLKNLQKKKSYYQ